MAVISGLVSAICALLLVSLVGVVLFAFWFPLLLLGGALIVLILILAVLAEGTKTIERWFNR